MRGEVHNPGYDELLITNKPDKSMALIGTSTLNGTFDANSSQSCPNTMKRGLNGKQFSNKITSLAKSS